MYRLIHKLEDSTKIDYTEPVFFDIETIGLYGFPRLIQVYQEGWDEVDIYDSYFVSYEKVWERLKPATLIGFNLSYDFGTMKDVSKDFEDLYYLSKLAFPYLKRHSLDAVLGTLGIDMSTEDKKSMQKADWSAALKKEMLTYAAEDVMLLPKLWRTIQQYAGMFVYRLDKLTLRYMIDAQQNGMPVSKERHHQLRAELVDKLSALEDELPINYNSSQQVREYLGTKKADAEVLKQMMDRSPLEDLLCHCATTQDRIMQAKNSGSVEAAKIFYAKKFSKQLNFLQKYDKPRVYGHFNPNGARSGRFSCSEENIQQIPNELKKLFGFDREEEGLLVAVDFPQIELRIAVAMWGEPTMEKLFKEGKDLHIATASYIYGKKPEEITKQERQVAKSANFGLLYGMGARKFRNYVHTNTGIDMTEAEAKTVREQWFNLYSGFRTFHQKVQNEMRESPNGFYAGITLFGRPYVGETISDALNIMVQGTGAELMKLSLHYLLKKHPEVKVVNVIHDAIVAEVRDYEEGRKVGSLIMEAMEEAWQECCKFFPVVKDLPCPLDADISHIYGG